MNQPAFLYCNYASSASVVATDSYSGHDVDDVLNPTEDLTHRFADASGTKSYILDLGAAESIEMVALLGEALDGITLEVRGSTDNFAASDDQLLAGTAISAALNCAWQALTTTGAYRYVKINLSSIPSNLEVAHICVGALVELPLMNEDYDPDRLEVTGQFGVSGAGYFTGSQTEKVMRDYRISFDQVTAAEYPDILALADACIKTARPAFFVPDIDEDDVYFGWFSGLSFSAPRPDGVRTVAPITFTTRAA